MHWLEKLKRHMTTASLVLFAALFFLLLVFLMALTTPWISLPLIALLFLVTVVVTQHGYVVNQSEAYVIESFGKFQTVWDAGYHILIPAVMNIAKKVDLREKQMDIEPQPVITSDRITIEIDTIGFYQVTDPKLYTYGVEDPEGSIKQLVMTNLRNIVGSLTMEESFTSRDLINSRIRSVLDEAADPWGIKVTRLEVQSITPPDDVQAAMRQLVIAQEERQAVEQRAEAEKAIRVKAAEGEAEAIKQIQTALAESLVVLNAAPGGQGANLKTLQDQMIKLKAIEAMQKVADGRATKIIIPSEMQGLAGLAAGTRAIWGDTEPVRTLEEAFQTPEGEAAPEAAERMPDAESEDAPEAAESATEEAPPDSEDRAETAESVSDADSEDTAAPEAAENAPEEAPPHAD